MLTPATVKLFDKLNCSSKHWQQGIYSTANAWDNPKVQTVACYAGSKYALAPAVVQGSDLSGVQAQDQTTGWVVTFNVKSPASKALGALTTTMVSKYYDSLD